MNNSPNRGVNYHIFQNKGNYPVILIYGETYSDLERKKIISSLAIVSILLLGISPILSPICAQVSFVVFEERLTRLMNMDYSVGDDDILVIESWNL